MMGQLSYKYIPYIGMGAFAFIALIIFIYVITVKLKEKRNEEKFDKQLHYSINPEEEQKEEESFVINKLKVLPEMLIKAGLVNENTLISDIQRRMILAGAVIFTVFTVLTQNPLGGIVPVFFVYLIARFYALLKINKKRNLMNEQIPAFVSIFKANIQANQHAQNAMVNAINNTADPLHRELARPKSIMEAGDFQAGIISLRMNTENETLRQMASCIELASSTGSNIEDQIETIEGIIESKQLIEREKRLGVNENKPLFYVASVMVPLSFIGSYFLSDMHREYWFTTTTSYLVILGVILVMSLSIWGTWKVIKNIDIG